MCHDCIQCLELIENPCVNCALPLPNLRDAQELDYRERIDNQCGACITQPTPLDQIMTNYIYTAPLRFLIHHFKYHEGYFLTSTLTELMLHALPENYKTDCIIPVPMHTTRLRERGFHHTLWLAKALSKKTGIQVDNQTCIKIKHTRTSAQLSAKERQKNTANAYLVLPNTYRHVTLLDDLTTTRETGNQIAKLLKESGVETVALWCIARAL